MQAVPITESWIYSRKCHEAVVYIYVIIKLCIYNFSVFIIMDRQAISFLIQQCIALDDFSEGHSDYWAFGLLRFRTIGHSEYWAFGLLDLRTIEISDYWAFGLLGLRTIGTSDYWALGLSGRHRLNELKMFSVSAVPCSKQNAQRCTINWLRSLQRECGTIS